MLKEFPREQEESGLVRKTFMAENSQLDKIRTNIQLEKCFIGKHFSFVMKYFHLIWQRFFSLF